jgi:hypothetical protein
VRRPPWQQAVVNRRVGVSHDDLPLRRSTAEVGIISFAAVRGECHLRSGEFTARLKDNQDRFISCRMECLTHGGVGRSITTHSWNPRDRDLGHTSFHGAVVRPLQAPALCRCVVRGQSCAGLSGSGNARRTQIAAVAPCQRRNSLLRSHTRGRWVRAARWSRLMVQVS